MKALILALFVIVSIDANCQIIFSGKVISEKTGEPISNVNIAVKNDPNWTITDQSGLFEFKFDSTNLKEFKFEASILKTDTTITVKVKSDTTVVIKLKDPLTFNQPCRLKKSVNDISIDIPLNDDYQRLRDKREEDLDLKTLIKLSSENKFRIWVSPAFDYLGGYVMEGVITDETIEIVGTTFESNYLTIPDSLRYIVITENPNNYRHPLEFNRDGKSETINLNKQVSNELRQLLTQFKTESDYCSSIVNSEYYCCLDGIHYDFEYRIDNEYKLVSFSNPSYQGEAHKQIQLFQKLLEIVD